MGHVRLVRSTVPHARIVVDRLIDAERVPGFLGHLTGDDLPTPFGILPVSQDEHALCPELVRFVGDPVAAVAATTEDAAWEAARRVRSSTSRCRRSPSVEEALATPEPRIHDYGDDGNLHKKVSMEFGDVEAGFADGRPGARGHLPLRGQHPPADGAARDGRLAGGRRPGDRRLLDPDAALPPPCARQGARVATGARAGGRDPLRRRLRRQERPVQPRDRRRRDGAQARPAGEGGAHPRGGLLLPPRPPPGADACQDRLHEGRRDHRAAPQDRARRRRLRQLRRRLDLLHRGAADGHLRAAPLPLRRRSAPSPTSRRAARSAATARRSPASPSRSTSTRRRTRSASTRRRSACATSPPPTR